MPPRRWLWRVGVPIALIIAALIVIAAAARDAFWPAIVVRTVPAVPGPGYAASRAAADEDATPSGTAYAAPEGRDEPDGSAEPAGPARASDPAQPARPSSPSGPSSGPGTGANPTPDPIAFTGDTLVQAAGWIEPDPFPVNVSALAEGVVREVLVLEGEAVVAGQVVARLIEDDARLELAKAQAERQQREADAARAEAALRAAKERWENPVAMQHAVQAAAAQLAAAKAALASRRASVDAAEARAAELRDKVQRQAPLAESGAVAGGEFARLKLRLAEAEAEVAAANADLELAQARVREQEAALVAAETLGRLRTDERLALEASEAEARRAAGALAAAEASVNAAALRLERMEVRSPVPGIVLERRAQPGSRIHFGTDPLGAVVVRLYDPAHLQVRVDVPLADAAKVGLGQPALVTTEALPGQEFRGRVTRLVHEANVQRNTVQVKVALEAPAAELRPEMLCRVRLLGSRRGGPPPKAPSAARGAEERPTSGDGLLTSTDASSLVAAAGPLLVSREAVHRDADGRWCAWVVKLTGPGGVGRATLRTLVVVGDGEVLEVSTGLRPGDRLIVQPPPNLREGDRVRIQHEASDAEAPATGASAASFGIRDRQRHVSGAPFAPTEAA